MPKDPKRGIRELEREGCQKKKGGKGGHQKMYNPSTKKTSVVPVHTKAIDDAFWRAIRRQLGLPDIPPK